MQSKQSKILGAIIICISILMGGGMLLFAWTTNEAADVVIGHEFMTQGDANSQDATEKTLYFPTSSYVNAGKLFVADTNNHRVLIYNSIPASDDAAADVVVGQTDMYSSSANQGTGCATNTVNGPIGVFATGTRLFIADTENNRVLIFNTIPTVNNTAADVVVGQTTMSNNTGGTQVNRLKRPYSVFAVSGGKMFIADNGNHRALIFNSIPAANGASANVVVGQADFTSATANQGGAVAANTLSGPNSVYAYNNKLYVADGGNNRVLIYNSIPAANDTAADIALGQPDLTSNGINQGGGVAANTLYVPGGVSVYGTQIFVSDNLNHRALIYDMPVASDENADYVIGQANMTSGTADQGGAAAANTLDTPNSVISDGTNVYVADRNNNRVLIYSTPIAAADDSAEYAVGQADKTSTGPNRGGITLAYSLSSPRSAYSDGTSLFVADYSNNRVLVFNTIPSSNKASADVVIGQPDFTSSSASCAAAGMETPTGVYADATRLYVVAFNQYRVLVYDSPYTTGEAASAVLGVGVGAEGTCGGGTAANQFANPYGIHGDATYVYVTEDSAFTNRVMMFTKPISTDQSATYVVGQPDLGTFGTTACSADKLNNPYGVASDGTNLFIADRDNNRVLLWTSIPVASGASANFAIGQANLTSCTANQGGGVAANTLNAPEGVYTDGTSVYIADTGNNRILIYNSIPAASNASADVVIGQSNMTAFSAGTSDTALDVPTHVMDDGTNLYVTDRDNNRVLIYNPPTGETGQVIRFW